MSFYVRLAAISFGYATGEADAHLSFSPIFIMRRQFILKIMASILMTVSMIGCQKNLEVSPAPLVTGKSISQDATNYSFNWETATTMPASASAPYAVPMPWSTQSGHAIDAAIVSDYKSHDGWVLVYNTFAPDNFPNPGDKGALYNGSKLPGGLYFALYNRYRGLLRFYEFVPTHDVNTTTQLNHGLKVYTGGGSSNTTNMLNFEGSDLVDADIHAGSNTGFSKTSKESLDDNGGWYSFQYQIGYDMNYPSTSFP
ncbi:MAG: hypothetical protein ACRYG7_06835, partial [Janthinobacterium lividum]